MKIVNREFCQKCGINICDFERELSWTRHDTFLCEKHEDELNELTKKLIKNFLKDKENVQR